MYLFFDTETTGLPRNWNAPVTDLSNWPRLVQLAWLLYEPGGRKVSGRDCIVKPEGFAIPRDAAMIHGITTERALKEGVSLRAALEEFSGALDKANFIVAHNMRFDEKIVGAELLRAGVKHRLFQTERICTMTAATEYCGLPGSYGRYKWPKLSELYFKLFNGELKEAHNAAVDIEACAECFWELRRRRIL